MAADPKPKTSALRDGESASLAVKVPGLRVSALVEGFRRAGRAWSTTAEDVPLASLDKAQIAALKAEPGLRVTECEIEVPAE